MRVSIACLTAVSIAFVGAASAQDGQAIEVGVVEAPIADEDDLVRLPGEGQGKLKPGAKLETPMQPKARLKPAGGLMVSFDADGDGRITKAEVQTGVNAAFLAADANSDGELTALEQQAWAEALPTRDDTLANPARFDPNLDRRVVADEFQDVILTLASEYAGEGSEDILIANLTAAPRPDDNWEERQDRRRMERERRERERDRQRW